MTFLAEMSSFLKPVPQQKIYGDVKKLKSQASQLGFSQIELDCANSVGIVQNSRAIELFDSIIQKIDNRVKNSQLNAQLRIMRDKYSKNIVNTKTKQFLSIVDPQTKMITLIRIFYFKKPQQTLFYHQINQFKYKQASKLIKMSESTSNNKGKSFVCFSSYSSSSKYQQYFVEQKRGTQGSDLTLLFQITNANQEKIKKDVQWMDQVEEY